MALRMNSEFVEKLDNALLEEVYSEVLQTPLPPPAYSAEARADFWDRVFARIDAAGTR